MKVGNLVSFSDLTIDNALCAGTGIILEVYPAKLNSYPTYLVAITVVGNKYVDSFTYQAVCYADSWGMALVSTGDITICEQVNKPHTLRIKGKFVTAYDYQAHQLAWLLLKINTVMTSKVKGFRYFLTIAYKMLCNEAHFIYVLKGLSIVNTAMLTNKAISMIRFNNFITCYTNLRIFSGYKLCNLVAR
jgi:hypothetical protein